VPLPADVVDSTSCGNTSQRFQKLPVPELRSPEIDRGVEMFTKGVERNQNSFASLNCAFTGITI